MKPTRGTKDREDINQGAKHHRSNKERKGKTKKHKQKRKGKRTKGKENHTETKQGNTRGLKLRQIEGK